MVIDLNCQCQYIPFQAELIKKERRKHLFILNFSILVVFDESKVEGGTIYLTKNSPQLKQRKIFFRSQDEKIDIIAEKD